MEKLIEFYPCPVCRQNLFEIWAITEEEGVIEKPYLKLRGNIRVYIGSQKDCFVCNQCSQVLFYEEYSDDVFIQKIKDFIQNHPEQIGEEFGKIWKRFLKQKIESRLKEISN